MPFASRWDYAIGVRRGRNADAVIWVEVHPASSTSEVKNVLDKLIWLKEWATQDAPSLMHLTREYVWVANGKVAFSSNSPQRKRLAAAGIRFAGSQYNMQAN